MKVLRCRQHLIWILAPALWLCVAFSRQTQLGAIVGYRTYYCCPTPKITQGFIAQELLGTTPPGTPRNFGQRSPA